MSLTEKLDIIERKYKLFDLVLDGEYIWDIIRYPVMYRLTFNGVDLKRVETHSVGRMKKIKKVLESILFMLFCEQRKYLFLATSRYKNENGDDIDKILIDSINCLKRDAVIIEHCDVKHSPYKSYYVLTSLFRKFVKEKKMPRTIYDFIRNAFENEGVPFTISYNDMCHYCHEYYSEYKYYNWLIKRIKPKAVLMCVGNAKSIFRACKDNNVTSLLYQHAVVTPSMVEFSYPEYVERNKILFADIFFTLSEKWGKGFRIPAKLIPLGNNYFVYNGKSEGGSSSIIFVSSLYHSQELMPLAQEVSIISPEIHIYYKLHPEEIKERDRIEEYFNEYENVQVVGTEYPVEGLIAKSSMVVLIRSTVLYSALDQGKKVCIYNRLSTEDDSTVIYRKDVRFVESAQEVKEFYQEAIDSSERCSFFESFQPNVLYETLEGIQYFG